MTWLTITEANTIVRCRGKVRTMAVFQAMPSTVSTIKAVESDIAHRINGRPMPQYSFSFGAHGIAHSIVDNAQSRVFYAIHGMNGHTNHLLGKTILDIC